MRRTGSSSAIMKSKIPFSKGGFPMKHGKKIKTILTLLAASFLLTTACGAEDFFTSSSNRYPWKAGVGYSAGDEKIRFILNDRSTLKLVDENAGKTLLYMPNPRGGNGPVYRVRTVYDRGSGKTFYEITGFTGAEKYNAGYWIIGKEGNHWVKYVTLDDLSAMGYDLDLPNQKLESVINGGNRGKFIINSIREYKNGETTGRELMLSVELHWNEEKKDFDIIYTPV